MPGNITTNLDVSKVFSNSVDAQVVVDHCKHFVLTKRFRLQKEGWSADRTPDLGAGAAPPGPDLL